MGAENLAPSGIRSPDRPARSESLYRLSHPCPALQQRMNVIEPTVTKIWAFRKNSFRNNPHTEFHVKQTHGFVAVLSQTERGAEGRGPT